jgi:hypothetical protein
MADPLARPWPEEQRVVSYAQWHGLWTLVQECEVLAQHWREQVSRLRRALRTHTLADAERAECQTVLQETSCGLHQARSALAALKTRLLQGCTVSGLATPQ